MNLAGMSVGVDYHQDSLRVTMLSEDGAVLGSRSVANDVDRLVGVVSRFGKIKGIALEACTGSANFAEELRKKTGWPVVLCHPGYVQRMRHNPDKSDASDSQLLADLHRVGYLPVVWLAPEEIRELRTLTRHREMLVQQIRAQKLRIRAFLRRERVKLPQDCKSVWSVRGRQWLVNFEGLGEHTLWAFRETLAIIDSAEMRLKRTMERLLQFAKRDSLIQMLMRQKGVGLTSATLLRAEVGTFTRFSTGKEFSRFCGLTPRNASSGTRQADAGLIKAGNPILRSALIQCGHCLCRFDSYWKVFAAKMRSNGKKPCVVIAAVVNRWLRKMFYEFRDFELSAAA